MIGNRTSEMFCFSAPKDGKITKITNNGVMLEYADGTTQGVVVGTEYGHAAGSIYPQEIKPLLKEGEKFKKGDVITYNTNFFEPDLHDKKKVVYKTSVIVKTAFMETNQTLEDSSAISRRIGNLMNAKTTHIRSFMIEFAQNVRNIKPVGSQVNPLDILVYIEDEITSGTGNIDEESLDILKKFSKLGPSAKYKGTIDRIEVFYNGNKDDMSPSLKSLADKCDKELAARCKAVGKKVVTGEVNNEYRVDGTPLEMDKAELRFYITTDTPMGVGDKGIFANQMKSVVGEVMDYDVHTESGITVDAIFSYSSTAKRMVHSPELIGTTTTLLKVIADRAVKIYEE